MLAPFLLSTFGLGRGIELLELRTSDIYTCIYIYSNDVSCEFDEFRVGTHLCNLRTTSRSPIFYASFMRQDLILRSIRLPRITLLITHDVLLFRGMRRKEAKRGAGGGGGSPFSIAPAR